jgi:hypothetical protein
MALVIFGSFEEVVTVIFNVTLKAGSLILLL